MMALLNGEKPRFIHIIVCAGFIFQIVKCNDAYNLNGAKDYLFQTCPSYAGCGGGYLQLSNVCCIQCSCNSTCIDSHSCCPESQYAPLKPRPYRSEDQRLVCRNTVFIGSPGNIYFHPEYEFIDACPDTRDDRILVEFCEKMKLTNKSGIVADNTPVLDKITRISYGNIYCARCNDVDEASLESWQPKLVCNENFNLRAESFGQENGLEQLIEYNRCEVSFEPPESFNDVKPCFTDVIDACNVTGNWKTYNQLDEYHCRNLDMLYVTTYPLENKYKNIFCAMCNGENVYAPSEMNCPFPQNQHTMSMTILLDLTISEIGIYSSQLELRQSSRDQCLPSFKYDPIMDECRLLFCSLPYNVDISTSTCKLFHRYIKNGVIVHAFELVMNTSTKIREAQNITEEIYDRFSQDPNVSICNIGVFYQTDMKEDGYSLSNFTSSNWNVSSLYLLVYSRITDVSPRDENVRHTKVFHDHLDFENIFLLDSKNFDPWMLRMYDDKDEEGLDWIRLDYKEGFTSNFNFDGTNTHYTFHNPYDHTMILGHVDNRRACRPRLYERDFLLCSSFLYETTNLFRRKQDGLMIEFEGPSVEFNFSEFKTVNHTTLRVCSDSVITKMKAVSSAEKILIDGFALGIVLTLIFIKMNFDSES